MYAGAQVEKGLGGGGVGMEGELGESGGEINSEGVWSFLKDFPVEDALVRVIDKACASVSAGMRRPAGEEERASPF